MLVYQRVELTYEHPIVYMYILCIIVFFFYLCDLINACECASI